ncbi:MAG: DUF4097 domain-containing protein [bacterium]
MRRRILLFSFGLLSCWWSLSAAQIKEVEEKRFQMRTGGSVTVIGDEGRITVSSWDRDEVHLKITKTVWEQDKRRAQELMEELFVKIDHSADRLFIKEAAMHGHDSFRFADLFDSNRWRHHTSYQIDYELTVPARIRLRIENDEGDVEVSRVSGRLDLQVDEGNVTLKDLQAVDVRLRLDEGDVECETIRGPGSRLDFSVDEGGIRLVNCELRDVQLGSDEGDIMVSQVKTGDCRISSDEGDVEVELQLPSEGRCRLSTDEGHILITLSEESNVSLDLTTADGRIRSDFAFSIHEWGEDGERLNGVLGRAESRLTATTDDGNIILKGN